MIKPLQTIAVRTFLIIALCMVIPFFLTFAAVRHQYENYIQQQLSSQIISSISKSEEAVYQSFRNMAGFSSAVVTRVELLEALEDDTRTYYEINAAFDKCVSYAQINNLFMTEQLFVTMFDARGRCYSNWNRNFQSYDHVLEMPWVQAAREQQGHLVWDLFSPSFILERQGQKMISLARSITNPMAEKDLGVLIISMPQERLSQVLAGYCFDSGDSVFLLGDGGVVLLAYSMDGNSGRINVQEAFEQSAANHSGSMHCMLDGVDYLTSYYTLDAPWKMGEQELRIYHFTEYQSVISSMSALSMQMNAVMIVVLLAALGIAVMIARSLVAPIRRLSRVMSRYHLGDSLEGLALARRDEIGVLNRSFRSLTLHVQSLFSEAEREYRAREKYRFEALKAQLNPHFLFNALNVLRYMAMLTESGAVSEGIDALASVLKYSMSRDGDWVRVADELEHVKSYVAIQNMRFGSCISVETDFDARELALYTLRFTLQPIVENAIIHGFKNRTGQCLIRIYGFVEEETFHLYVEDNGVGVAAETVQRMNGDGRPRQKMTGIGFSNVKDMIEMTFGQPYTLRIESSPEVGTIVHYLLPVLTHPKGGAPDEENPDR